MISKELEDRLNTLVTSPILLVASDYDGTLSPIMEIPQEAYPIQEAVTALRALSSLPQTHVAVISGRSLSDLKGFLHPDPEMLMIGSHGSEFEAGFATSLSSETRDLREKLFEALKEIAPIDQGFIIEEKPASFAVHYRRVLDASLVERTLERLKKDPGSWNGIFTRGGKMVVEFSVVDTNKGRALQTLQHRVGAYATLFFGDDLTDEDAFAVLKGSDVGIKVGEGDTKAQQRVDDPFEVARILAYLAEKRAEWLRGAAPVPIQEHSLISDSRTMGLISPKARVTWLCLPRVDSPAIFAEILGGPSAGYFSVESANGDEPLNQYYDSLSMHLVTEWKHFKVIDYLDVSGGRAQQRAGRTELLRVIEGSGPIVIEFAPRLEFGRIQTRFQSFENGLEILDSVEPIVLRSKGVEWKILTEGNHETAIGKYNLQPGKPLALEMRYGTRSLDESVIAETKRRASCTRHWSQWAEQLVIPSALESKKDLYQLVLRSALTLKSLCYGPTGAILAAATTSLPEHVGGIRNWDYRFSWLRDGALSAQSLVRLQSFTEALAFLDWVLGLIDHCAQPERLQPLYTVLGTELGTEATIAELSGYAGSRPVRVGNLASQQVQLDVFGPIVDLVWDLSTQGASLSTQHWKLVEAMVSAVEARWSEPDHGIWEIRGPRRHHVHSKAMCWLAVDRGIKLSAHFSKKAHDSWKDLRDKIREEILMEGWNDQKKSFSAAYGSDDLDAAALCLGLIGLLDPRDPRFISTVRAVQKELQVGSTVFRYRSDDGLPGVEGGFHLCTTWMIEALNGIGERKEAETLLRNYIKCAGKTGLFCEEVDPKTGRGLGNHPQAYSHLGLIFSCLNLFRSTASSDEEAESHLRSTGSE